MQLTIALFLTFSSSLALTSAHAAAGRSDAGHFLIARSALANAYVDALEDHELVARDAVVHRKRLFMRSTEDDTCKIFDCTSECPPGCMIPGGGCPIEKGAGFKGRDKVGSCVPKTSSQKASSASGGGHADHSGSY